MNFSAKKSDKIKYYNKYTIIYRKAQRPNNSGAVPGTGRVQLKKSLLVKNKLVNKNKFSA
jgi:hypothetical protein